MNLGECAGCDNWFVCHHDQLSRFGSWRSGLGERNDDRVALHWWLWNRLWSRKNRRSEQSYWRKDWVRGIGNERRLA